MEKLQAILKYKFWLLFAVAVVLPPIGWWSATGALKSEIEARRQKLDQTLSGIPTGQQTPNESWIAEITKRNQAQERINLETAMRLWAAQRPLRVWPSDVADVMQRFDDRPTEEEIAQLTGPALNVPDLYAQDYERELRRIWELVDPFDITRSGGTVTTSSPGVASSQPTIDLRRDANAKRKVVFPFEAIPKVPNENWKAGLPPSFDEIWDAQEDIWLLTELLLAIRRLNRNANNIAEAHIRRIDQIRLFGGKWSDGVQESGSGGAPGEAGDMSQEYAAISGGMPGGPLGQQRQITADVDLHQWFTDLNELGGTSGTNPLATMAMSGSGSAGEMPAADSTEKRRYIDDEELPYRTRGFYLKVVMDHRQLPDFQAELLKSRWPVQFVVIQQAAFNLSRLGSSGSTAGAGSGLLTVGEGSATPSLSSPTGTFGPPTAATPLGSGGPGGRLNPLGLRRPGQPVIIPPEVGLSDASLATVVIVGTLRIYKKPEVPNAESSEGAQPSAPSAGQPTASAQPAPTGSGTGTAQPVPPPAAATTPQAGSDTPAAAGPSATPSGAQSDAPAASGATPTPPAGPPGTATAPATPAPKGGNDANGAPRPNGETNAPQQPRPDGASGSTPGAPASATKESPGTSEQSHQPAEKSKTATGTGADGNADGPVGTAPPSSPKAN